MSVRRIVQSVISCKFDEGACSQVENLASTNREQGLSVSVYHYRICTTLTCIIYLKAWRILNSKIILKLSQVLKLQYTSLIYLL
jgi:hypothetical protein